MSTNTLRTILVTLLKLSDSIMKTVLETMGTLKGCDVVDVTTDRECFLKLYEVPCTIKTIAVKTSEYG